MHTEVGQPVKWVKTIPAEEFDPELDLKLIEGAKNVVVEEIIAINNHETSSKRTSAEMNTEITAYEITFETDAPELKEEKPDKDDELWTKKVTISSNEKYEGEFEYTNVLSYTEIVESNPEDIKLFWSSVY